MAHDDERKVDATGVGPVSALASARILMAEDNIFNQQIIAELLEAAGAEVTVADNGAEALALLRDGGPFDLVLMDVQLPGMDGLETARRIRSNPAHANLTIVALTAGDRDEGRTACLSAGMNDFASKPVDPDQLYATLAQWLSRPRSLAQVPPVPSEWPGHAAPTTVRSALSDPTAVGELFRHDTEKMRNFVGKFISSTRLSLSELEAACGANDLRAVARLAHGVRGSVVFVGAQGLADLCLECEVACHAGDGPRANECRVALAALFERVASELLQQVTPD